MTKQVLWERREDRTRFGLDNARFRWRSIKQHLEPRLTHPIAGIVARQLAQSSLYRAMPDAMNTPTNDYTA